jgi:hypothetical protein
VAVPARFFGECGRRDRAAPRPTRGETTTADRRLKIALYSGVFVRHDAISSSLRWKLKVLDRLSAVGVPLSVTIFACASEPV